MFEHGKSAHEMSDEVSEAQEKKQMTNIKRLISKALREMTIEDLALVNKLILHRTQIQRYFELHKMLGRQIG